MVFERKVGFENFNGLPKSIKRFGFESGEVIQSGLGYKNVKKYGAGMLQTNSLKGVSEDKLFPKKDKKGEKNEKI